MRRALLALLLAHHPQCSQCAELLTLRLRSTEDATAAFPPGRRFPPAGFWQAGPVLPLAKGPPRPAADFVATGEAAMLGWFPRLDAPNKMITPLADSHSLVRLLGSGESAKGTPGEANGDVVLRDPSSGALHTLWELLWSRLDPWVNASGLVHPILVLDNVPWGFCDPRKCSSAGSLTPGAKYGMDYGPANCTEYGEWIETLLEAMVSRYGRARASEFWFRVGTEPNTRPGHWNDTNSKYVEEYRAVSAAVEKVLPQAKVGMANMGADGSDSGWYGDVVPIAEAIARSNARVDFLAMSCYGRGTGNRYTLGTAYRCSERLQSMRALGGEAWASLPAQAMEYGLQQNADGIVDEDPGVFGAAWQLATSTVHARLGVERGFQWHFGELAFAYDHPNGPCSAAISSTPCSLYAGTAWVTAQASLLFGNTTADCINASVLEAVEPGSNATQRGASVDGIGGWSTAEAALMGQNGSEHSTTKSELRLLLVAFSPKTKTEDGDVINVSVSFDRPADWPTHSPTLLQARTATLDRASSPFDAIWREGYANGWLTNSSDANVYPLSLSVTTMLTKAGKDALVQQKGAHFLEMQRRTFASTEWRDAHTFAAGNTAGGETATVTCDSDGHGCKVSLSMAPPSVCALWVRHAGAGGAS